MLAHRSCPHCRRPVSGGQFFFKSTIWSAWDCPGCGTPLRISKRRRVLASLCGSTFACFVGFVAIDAGLSRWWFIPIMMAAQIPFWWLDGVVGRANLLHDDPVHP